MVLRILDIHMQKNLSGQLSYTTQKKKINSKWIKDLNVRPKPITLLDENIRGKKISLKTFFVYNTPNTQTAKAKINMWDYVKIEKLLHSKRNNKMKRQSVE